MPNTINRGWTYPVKGKKPYYTEIVSFFNEVDADVQVLWDRELKDIIPAISKGGLISDNGSDTAVLPVGSNDSVLIADSTEATGLKWGTITTYWNKVGNQLVPTTAGDALAINSTDTAVDSINLTTVGGIEINSTLTGTGSSLLYLRNTGVQLSTETGTLLIAGFVQDVDISAAGAALSLSATGSGTGNVGNVDINASSNIILSDGNKSTSTYASDLVLSDTSSEWDDFETNFGEVSLLNALNQSTGTSAHAASHENGGADKIIVSGLSGVLANMQDADKLYGNDISSNVPNDREVLQWVDSNSKWTPMVLTQEVFTDVNASTYTALDTDVFLGISYSSTGLCVLTITSAEIAKAGRYFYIIDTGGNSEINNITINTEGSETINGELSATLDQNYGSITLISDGSNLFVR